MLINQFPAPLSTHEKRINSLSRKNEMKKIKSSALKNCLVSLVILILSSQIDILWIKIIVIIIGLNALFMAFLLYKLTSQKYDDNFYTKIYDDKIIHSQVSIFKSNKKVYTINYEDIEKSNQNIIGYLEIYLKENHSSFVEEIKSKGIKLNKKIETNKIVFVFQNQDGKYYLIKNMAEKINYSKNRI